LGLFRGSHCHRGIAADDHNVASPGGIAGGIGHGRSEWRWRTERHDGTGSKAWNGRGRKRRFGSFKRNIGDDRSIHNRHLILGDVDGQNFNIPIALTLGQDHLPERVLSGLADRQWERNQKEKGGIRFTRTPPWNLQWFSSDCDRRHNHHHRRIHDGHRRPCAPRGAWPR